MNHSIAIPQAQRQHRLTQVRKVLTPRRSRRDRTHDLHPDNRPGQTWVEARSFALWN